MDLKEIKQEKDRCEFEIRGIINAFILQTKCEVCGVDLMISRVIGIAPAQIDIVTMDVRVK